MARALLGYVGSAPQHLQELEVARLRAKVRELQIEISELRAEAAARRALDAKSVDAELDRIVANGSPTLI